MPALAGYIAFAIADRPGIAPGFTAGAVAGFVGAGFIGGIVGGLVADSQRSGSAVSKCRNGSGGLCQSSSFRCSRLWSLAW